MTEQTSPTTEVQRLLDTLTNSPLGEPLLTELTELKRLTEQTSALCLRLALAEEHHRSWAAGELHDDALQYCVAANLRLQSLDEGEENLYEPVRQRIEGAIRGIKRVETQLFSPALMELGLSTTVESLAKRTARAQGWDLELDISENLPPLSEIVLLSIFRVIQEGLKNAEQYSQTERIVVSVRPMGKEIEILVRDWGVGFNAVTAGNDSGLGRLRDRVLALQGTWSLSSSKEEGTSLRVNLPQGG